MEKIRVEVRSVYGRPTIYPANQAAEYLASIAGTKTLRSRDLDLARALGHEVEEVRGAALVIDAGHVRFAEQVRA